jgi:D-tyrosyl-tRNA(Tyr) deacylase
MRVVIQRVGEAEVKVDGETIGKIGSGLLVLAGFEANDNQKDLEWMSGKICKLRIFNDENGVMNISVKDAVGDILLVSQFTLHTDAQKGNRPSYIKAARPEIAIPLYEQFIKQLEFDLGKSIQTGRFGANMKVSLMNDGPVTILLDSKKDLNA